ncbi:MAG TPA: GGDEF domain-containing protein [Planctomycetota bacterium]|nr:GGDEF domain-containing protein [Planctomycetota bacterium]
MADSERTERKGSFQKLAPVPPTTAMRPVPFFSRLGVKHGIILTALLMLSMVIVTGLQLTEALHEMQRSAAARGRSVADALAPLVLPAYKAGKMELLRGYLMQVSNAREIDYVQVVDNDGRVQLSTDPRPGERIPSELRPGWLHQFHATDLDRDAVSVPWSTDKNGQAKAGVDVFVALSDDPEAATPAQIEKSLHLRIGINFDEVLHTDTPRVIWRMIFFTLIVAVLLLLGLVMLLKYILRPVRELHLGLRAVASGDLDYQVPVYSRDEVGQLAQAFNATTARLKAAFAKIEELATRDPLTNLPNRRTFDERLAAEAARSRRYGHPFGLIMMDLDRFKLVNDQYGHPAGDEVLKFVARIVEANVRETDLPARVGGEEFAVILPESSAKEVEAVAEKLRTAVSAGSPPARQGLPEGVVITISAGAACSAGHLVTPESMISAADAALYASKGHGRNRVTMAPMHAGKTEFIKKVDVPPDASDSAAARAQDVEQR